MVSDTSLVELTLLKKRAPQFETKHVGFLSSWYKHKIYKSLD